MLVLMMVVIVVVAVAIIITTTTTTLEIKQLTTIAKSTFLKRKYRTSFTGRLQTLIDFWPEYLDGTLNRVGSFRSPIHHWQNMWQTRNNWEHRRAHFCAI